MNLLQFHVIGNQRTRRMILKFDKFKQYGNKICEIDMKNNQTRFAFKIVTAQLKKT